MPTQWHVVGLPGGPSRIQVKNLLTCIVIFFLMKKRIVEIVPVCQRRFDETDNEYAN